MSAERIRQTVVETLRASGVRVNRRLPLLDGPIRLRPAAEVAHRIVALYALAGLANGADAGLLREWLESSGTYAALEDDEREKFERPLSEADLAEVSWRQESLYALGWAAQLVETLPLPARECSLEHLFPRIPPEVPLAEFAASLTLRAPSEVAHQADLHHCLHWAVKHPRLLRSAVERRLNRDVIVERRQAFDWLLGSMAWSDVALDT